MHAVLLFIVLIFMGCSPRHVPLPTIAYIDLNRYLGTWYEIARYEHSFEKDCENVSATYSLRKEGGIDVLNLCTKVGMQSSAKGIAYTTDTSNSKLKVSFFRPFYGKYWIIMLDDNYNYAVIGEPSREYFWILSRTKSMDEATKNEILNKMPELGYSEDALIWTVQK